MDVAPRGPDHCNGKDNAMASTIILHLSRNAEDVLEGLVDRFGLQNVLNGLACICSGKADHIESK
jgi:hypothetical protein